MADDPSVTSRSDRAPSGRHVAVLLEPGRRGDAALARAAELPDTPGLDVTVVAIAPRVTTVCRSCGGVSARAFNCAVQDGVAETLREAIARLAPGRPEIRTKLLVEGADPPLAQWVAQGRFDTVLLPARRRGARSAGHPVARLLRRATGAEVRVVTRATGRDRSARSSAAGALAR